MLLGARAIIYTCPDLLAGKAFYQQVCGYPPHHDSPHYVGFAVSAFDLGLVPDGSHGAGSTYAYWGVADLEAEVARITGLGATAEGAVQDVGDGIRVAHLRDPFGNRLALMFNPNFDPAKAR